MSICQEYVDELDCVNISSVTQTRQFWLRRGNSADRAVIQQVFVDRDYAIDSFRLSADLHRLGQRILEDGSRPLILDAGANIGASALWFHLSFPDAKILAIEPHAGNCTLFRRNCQGIADISLLEGAIASSSGSMELTDPGLDHWGYRVVERASEGGVSVPVFAASELLDRCVKAGLVPFIVKIDIEGGESELFSKSTEWVHHVPLIAIELHDWMLPGQANSAHFLQALTRGSFDIVWRSENLFCFNNELLRR